MKIKVVISKLTDTDERFSFIVSQYNIANFFENFFDYFENFEDVSVRFFEIKESED